jgi:hypothetical protein
MRIRFSIIRPDILGQVRQDVEALRNAVDSGDMDGVDCSTAKLVALTDNCHSVDLTEEQWRAFLGGIRKKSPEFKSDYLLPGEICSEILPAVDANDCVLELPIDEEHKQEGPNV